MKRLTILRHAKSSWDLPNTDDFDRALNERGWNAARKVGSELKRRKISFDLCLASPAARARETLDGVSETYGAFHFPVRFEPRIYLADTATLQDLVRNIPDDVEDALLVGHNPGLERLILRLTDDDGGGLRDRVAEKYPTAALAIVELPAVQWNEVGDGSGTLSELILPRDLD